MRGGRTEKTEKYQDFSTHLPLDEASVKGQGVDTVREIYIFEKLESK